MLTLTRKNQSTGISAKDFFYNWNLQQYAYHDDLIGKWQNRNNTKEGLSTGLIENEVIMTKLAPFTIPFPLTITAGQGTKPSDFVYTIALRINGTKVFKITHDQKWAVNQDVIDPPSIADNSYYYLEYLDYYSFLPTTVTTAELDYIASPTDVVWAYTFDGNGRQVYSAGGGGGVTPTTGSVQPKWQQNTLIEITRRTLKELGVEFKDNELEQYGQSIISTGD